MYKRISIIGLAFFSGICTQCSTNSDPGNPPTIQDSLSNDRTTPVQVSIARKGIFHYRVSCNGDIRAASTYQVNAQTAGVVKLCKAKDGARFHKGDLIIQLETAPMQIQLQKAQSALLNAQGEYQSRLLGYQSLLEGKAAEQISAIKEKLRAETGLSQAELEIKNVQWQLQQATIVAPASGIVANVRVSPGMQVSSGAPLFMLYTSGDLLANVLILEEDAGQIQAGQRANVVPVGKDTKTYPAMVAGINPLVDANGMVTVHLKLHKTTGLFPGMHVSAMIEVPKHEAVIVPKNAVVLRSGERPVVFTIKDNLAQWHYVKTGLDNGQEVEILDGISPGDTVITSNNIQLAHDAPVSIGK